MPIFGSLYKLFASLVRHTRHIPGAHLMGAGVVAAAVASDVANTALITMVNRVINADAPAWRCSCSSRGSASSFPCRGTWVTRCSSI